MGDAKKHVAVASRHRRAAGGVCQAGAGCCGLYGPVHQAGDGAGEQSLEETLGRQADRAWCETRSPSP